MRRDTAAPRFGFVPFWELHLFAVDGVLRMATLREVCRGGRLFAWFFAGSWLILDGFWLCVSRLGKFGDLQIYVKIPAKIHQNDTPNL